MSRYPTLHSAYETVFNTHGYGALADAISCTVTREVNGVYDLELLYPVDGLYFSKLLGRNIIYAEVDPRGDKQPFRIYDVLKRTDGKVTVLAHHVSYDLGGIPVSKFSADSSGDALAKIKSNSAAVNPFTFESKRAVKGNYQARVPKSARNRLLDKEESILATYGGEFRFDHFKVEYLDRLGEETGYRIKYGVNLVDLSQESNFDKLYTGIYPYYSSGEDSYLELPEKIVRAEGEFGFVRALTVNLAAEFSVEPSVELLREHAKKYIEKNKIGTPEVSIELTHAHISRFGDFCTAPSPDDVELGDTVWVEYQKFNIAVTSRINRVKYDPLNHKYEAIWIGDVKKGFVESLLQAKRQREKLAELKSASNRAVVGAAAAMAVAEIAQLTAEGASETAKAGVSKASLKDGTAEISGVVLPVSGGEGNLSGVWRAVPYISGGSASEIVTRRDLISLGLIEE